MRVVLCVPTLRKPFQATLDAIAASVPLMDEAGWEHAMVSEVGCPYINAARATMLRKALDAKADVIVFIDHDVSWRPADLLKLVRTEGDFVAGTYRFKKEPEEYMGQLLADNEGKPIVRADGALQAFCAPAGFLKLTPRAVNKTIERFPHLAYGERHSPHVDFFNFGAHEHVFWGEDYAACRRWREIGEDVWTVPDLHLTHHAADGTPYPGNLHEFLLRQPGGSNDPKRAQ
jgi:hypothetical protein